MCARIQTHSHTLADKSRDANLGGGRLGRWHRLQDGQSDYGHCRKHYRDGYRRHPVLANRV